MNDLDFSRQMKVLAFLIGHESTVEQFNQAYQEALNDLKTEVETGQQSKEIIWQRIGHLKLLLFVQTVWNRTMLQIQQAPKEKAMMAKGMS